MQANAPRQAMHPLLWVAAVSVTLFSLVGIGAITGLIPTSSSKSASEAPALLSDNASQPALPGTPAAQAPGPVVTAPVAPPTAAQRPRPVHKEPQQVAMADPARPAAGKSAAVCMDCGTIAGVRTVEQAGQSSGVGAVAGGVVGAVLGNQIGSGRGRSLATIAGAAGGAYAGNQIEKSRNKAVRYEISVRMDDGSTRSVTQDSAPSWREGDRVRLVNGVLSSDS